MVDKPAAASAEQSRKQRLAKQLRDNLTRRKAQARNRSRAKAPADQH
jgi:hypothetical protein